MNHPHQFDARGRPQAPIRFPAQGVNRWFIYAVGTLVALASLVFLVEVARAEIAFASLRRATRSNLEDFKNRPQNPFTTKQP